MNEFDFQQNGRVIIARPPAAVVRKHRDNPYCDGWKGHGARRVPTCPDCGDTCKGVGMRKFKLKGKSTIVCSQYCKARMIRHESNL